MDMNVEEKIEKLMNDSAFCCKYIIKFNLARPRLPSNEQGEGI